MWGTCGAAHVCPSLCAHFSRTLASPRVSTWTQLRRRSRPTHCVFYWERRVHTSHFSRPPLTPLYNPSASAVITQFRSLCNVHKRTVRTVCRVHCMRVVSRDVCMESVARQTTTNYYVAMRNSNLWSCNWSALGTKRPDYRCICLKDRPCNFDLWIFLLNIIVIQCLKYIRAFLLHRTNHRQ